MPTAKGSSPRSHPPEATPAEDPQVRLSVNLNSEVAGELKAYAKRNGVSVTEAVRRAIALLGFADETRRNGGTLEVEENGALKEVLFL